jgi:bacterial leucyl aminopeptidase
MRAGYRSAFAIETEFHSSNPNIHTSRDDVDGVDVTWMAEFAKMGIGLAGELAGSRK